MYKTIAGEKYLSSRIKNRIIFPILLCMIVAVNVMGQDKERNTFYIKPLSYDFFFLEDLIIHSPAIGVELFLGDHNVPFNEVNRRFSASANYRAVIFQEKPVIEFDGEYDENATSHIPWLFHHIDINLDGRIKRHQLLLKFFSDAEVPLAGGKDSFQIGAAWGYEIIRRSNWSAILGAAYSYGRVWLFSPYFRLGIDTDKFVLSLNSYFPHIELSFTIAPESRVRFTTDIRMDTYREDYEWIFWYRIFGIGVKASTVMYALYDNIKDDFVCPCGHTERITFWLEFGSVFAVMDISFLRIEAGMITGDYIYDKSSADGPGKGFYISIKGAIPIL